MRCLDDDDVVKHITEMQRLKEALDAMSAPITDHAFSAYIKASLPEKFRPLLQTIATTTRFSGRAISSDTLIQEVYKAADENSVHANVDSATEQTAMAASEGKGRGGGRGGKAKCDNCDRTGHLKRDCWSHLAFTLLRSAASTGRDGSSTSRRGRVFWAHRIPIPISSAVSHSSEVCCCQRVETHLHLRITSPDGPH